jgi:SAM-dependent methyltransferase
MPNEAAGREADVPLVPGRFGSLAYTPPLLTVGGWMFLPGQELDSFRLNVNGMALTADEAPRLRDGVAERFASHPEARRSGFELRATVPEPALLNWAEIEVCGRVAAKDVCRINILYRLGFDEALPDTPAELRRRVSGAPASRTPIANYRVAGLETFSKFYKAITKHAGLFRRLLDWGCGCGRVTSFFLKYLDGIEVHGCDIDREAIEWCTGNLTKGHFAIIPPSPPTSYANDFFNVVTGCSVLTHLSRELQKEWLREMRRIIAPGGLLLASVNCDFRSTGTPDPPDVTRALQTEGISDRTRDNVLDGIAPEGYYRGTFQRKDYTCREFARYFKIMEYIELGMGNLQDLVVMRKE